MRITFAGCGDAFSSGGRFNTCFHVARASAAPFLIDCGASSLAALRRAGLDPGAVETVFVTHFHADHFMGLPFLVLDGKVRGRRAPLTILGPEGVAEQLEAAMKAAFQGSGTTAPGYELRVETIPPDTPRMVDGIRITATRVRHGTDPNGPFYGYRLDLDGRVLAYTGDTQWTDALVPLGRDADLLVAEASSWERDIPFHMSVATLRERLPQVGARRVILTHMGEDVLARLVRLGFEAAADGLVVEL